MSHARWKVFGYDSFAREQYLIGEYPNQVLAEEAAREAERRHAAFQDEALRDQVWIVPPEQEADTRAAPTLIFTNCYDDSTDL